ncbi:MAG: pilus assembly protein TadG-related protein [Pseudomonadota bacterium]|nr:pilus assembly protein TadG-related protein [Pseudomonadota bacterium]
MASNRHSRKGWINDRNGNIAIIFAMSLVPLVSFTGLAIDSLRALRAAEVASDALDAAALATAKVMSESDLDDGELLVVARRYFEANTSSSSVSREATFTGLSLGADRRRGAITLSVDASLPTSFGRIMNIDRINLSRASTAVFDQNDLELGLMLDVTGSMSGRKIRDLRLAAGDLVDILIPERVGGASIRLGIAPYAAAVNAGPYASRVSGGASRDGCVIEREGAHAYDDSAPSGANTLGAYPSRDVARNDNYDCPRSQVQPLTDNRRVLHRAIDRLDAGGYTAGHLGAAWAWYLVSPAWAGIWPGESTPAPYGSKRLVKAVVLMTDGEFNTSYRNGRANRTSDEQARNICDEMKARDVVVFTIGFDLKETAAIRTLEDCASSDRHHYLAADGEALRKAFLDIGVKLTNLRISQ